MGITRSMTLSNLPDAPSGKYEVTGIASSGGGNSFTLSSDDASINIIGAVEQCDDARGSGRCVVTVQKSGSTYTAISGKSVDASDEVGQLENVRIHNDRLYGKVEGRWVNFNSNGIQ